MKLTRIYTDGSCLFNPGPGGWAALKINPDGTQLTYSGFESRKTTNNRMELRAAIEGVKAIPPKEKTFLFTDSRYVVDGIAKLATWLETKKVIKNLDLWLELDKSLEGKQVLWRWVKGHSSNEYNCQVDVLAKQQAKMACSYWSR